MYDRMLDVGAELGVKKIKLGGGVFETEAPDIGAMRAALRTICDRAAPLDIDIAIEFLPFASIDSIDRRAWRCSTGLASPTVACSSTHGMSSAAA